jgi:nucleoside-diphosphate-sugar epimerase
MGEIGCLAQRDRMAVIGFRKGTVCGVSSRMRFDLVVNKMTLDAVRLGRITVNAPAAWRPILAIEDAVSAYVAAIESDISSGWIFNVFSENIQVLYIAQRVQRVVAEMTGRPVEIEDRGGIDPRDYQADQRRTLDILGWRPKKKIEDIAESVARYVLDSNADFDEDRFYNIRTFKAIGT